jgi:hypothetical protein
MKPSIHAVIGVRRRGPLTWYVRRSLEMANYPGVWTLLSIQFEPRDLPEPERDGAADALFARMSAERLGGAPVRVLGFLASGASDANPMGADVTLHLYEVEFLAEPRLDPRFYTGAAWLDAGEFERLSAGQQCGLCLRLWADYSWMAGQADRPLNLPGAVA